MASSSSLVVAGLLVSGTLTNAAATAYIVGDSKGWAMGVNYTSWASDKKFVIGDKLVFSYVSKEHTVTKVEASPHDNACGGAELSSDDSGLTTVPLDTAGDHHFICTVDDHCASGGMSLSVTVAAPPSTGARLLLPAYSIIAAASVGLLMISLQLPLL